MRGIPQFNTSVLYILVIEMNHSDSAIPDPGATYSDQDRPKPYTF
jgi:hypothetical protein